MKLMFDRELFPLKRSINQKLYTLFEQLKITLKDTPIHTEFRFPDGTDTTTGKISQGENHRQFPWVVLDFPKLFKTERIFAFRTMFWFGSGFSNSLIVGGELCDELSGNLFANRTLLNGQNFFFSLADDPWDHEISGNRSMLIEEISEAQMLEHIKENRYLKISRQFQSDKGEEIIERSVDNYTRLLSVFS